MSQRKAISTASAFTAPQYAPTSSTNHVGPASLVNYMSYDCPADFNWKPVSLLPAENDVQEGSLSTMKMCTGLSVICVFGNYVVGI